MEKYDLTPKQEEAVHVAKYAIEENMCFQAIVGQRAGKTRFILSLLDHYSDIKRIYVTGQRVNLIDAHVPGAKKYAISSERILELLNSENRHEAFNNTIVFVEECEYTENYSQILRLAATYGISVIGESIASDPHFFDVDDYDDNYM